MTNRQEARQTYKETTELGEIPRFRGVVDKRISLVLFLLVLFCSSYFVQHAGWNQNSRMALIMSIVNYHQLNIDPYQRSTGDKALYNGHYYSDKAVGTAMLGVPVYAVYRELQGFEDYIDFRNIYPVTVIVVSLPSATLSVLLYQLMRLLVDNRAWALLLSLFYSFGTLAFPFSTMLFGHQTAAFFAFAAFFMLVIARLRSSSAWLLFLAGVLASLAVLMEYQVVVIAAFLFIYAATFVQPKRRLVLYILGGVPGMALLLAYNFYTVGSPFTLAYSYVSNPEFAGMQKGFFGITQPRWSAFVKITLGPRGLLSQSIFLWLLPLGVLQMCRTAQWRRECALCIGVGLVFIIWNSSYYMPLGGWTPGARFLVPSLPFLIVPLVFLARLPHPYRLLTKSALLLTGVWSMCLYFLICTTDPQVPQEIVYPVRGYWLPHFVHENLMLNLGMLVFGLRGIESLAPLNAVFGMALATFVLLSRIYSQGNNG
jgi:hypothetical protein